MLLCRYLVVVLDRLDESASLRNIQTSLERKNAVFIKGDVRFLMFRKNVCTHSKNPEGLTLYHASVMMMFFPPTQIKDSSMVEATLQKYKIDTVCHCEL
jgi:hypothetical protein